MAPFTLKSALASLAVAGMFTAAALPHGASASSTHAAPPFAHDTLVGKHPVVYNDPFSVPGQFRPDGDLGKKTHWEGSLNLSDPTSTLTWMRVADSVSGAAAAVTSRVAVPGNAQASAPLQSGTRVRPHISSGTCGNGGVRLYQNVNFNGGDCIAFYGSGSQDLHILYPGCYVFCSHVNDTLEAVSTQGSMGSGRIACGGGNFYYYSQNNYPDMRQQPGGCWHNASVIYNN